MITRERPGPNQAHVSAEHVPKLRQFIQTAPPVLQRTVRAALVAESLVPQMLGPGAGAAPAGPVSAYGPSLFSRTAFSGSASEAWGGPTDAAAPKQAPPALKVVGQLKLTYIVAEGPEGMYLVDQHAAHERILFDEIRAKGQANSDARPGERLLEPSAVELTPGQVEVYQSNAQALANYGFEVEPFGPASYLLRAVPSIVSTQDPVQSLLNVLDMVAFEGLVRQQEDVLAASIACHGAIRAGKSLTEAGCSKRAHSP